MKVLVYPKDPNPYQELLYQQLKVFKVNYKYFASPMIDKHAYILGIPTFIFRLIKERLNGYDIFHIHWLYQFEVPIPFIGRLLSSIYFILFIYTLRVCRYKIVWTVHNILPHENSFISNKFVSKFLSNHSDAKIIHYKSAAHEMQDLGIATKNTYLIPHGNYINYYPNAISKIEARKLLKLENNNIIILFLGMIKEYKGIDELLNTAKYLNHNCKIIIAGNKFDNKLADKILNYNKSNVISHIRHIRDEELQIFYNAADLVALPFKKVTTSGSALLALGFKKPIIAPYIGGISEFPDNTGYYYNPYTSNALLNSVLMAVSNIDEISRRSINAYNYVKGLTWEEVAKKTDLVYKSLLTN